MSSILIGKNAIRYAEQNDCLLNKYADPIDDARSGITIDEANGVASEDPSLIWVEMADRLIAYCKGTDSIVYRDRGAEYGDGQVDSDEEPVWLLHSDDVDDWDIDALPQINTL